MDKPEDPPEYKYERFDNDDETVQLIRQGQEAAIKSLVEKDPAKIDEIQPNGYTLLQIAAYEGNKDLVKFLLDHGASIQVKAYSDETALHLACDRGHEQIVKMLLVVTESFLKRRSEVKRRDDTWGNTALHFAARGGNEEIAEFIVEQELLNINCVNKNKKTALHLASEEGHKAIVELLLDQGAKVESSTLNAAITGKNKSIVELILNSGVDINEEVFEGSLCLACSSGRLDIVKLLFERGPNINVEKGFFWRLLQHAANDKPTFEFLVDFAIDVNTSSDQEIHVTFTRGLSLKGCLSLACQYSYEDIVQKIFDLIPKAKTKEILEGWSLFNAAKGGNTKIFKLISDQVVNINDRSNSKRTVLHLACKRGNEEIVKILIERGADINAIDCTNRTVLHFAAEGGSKAIFKLLLDRGIDVNSKDSCWDQTVLHIICEKGHEDLLKILFESGKQIDMGARAWLNRDRRCCTALHLAAKRGNKNIVKLLLDRGLEIDVTNAQGESVLHLACEEGSEDVVELLIERGANVKIGADYEGKTVLHSAVSGGNKNIVKLLLDRGVDVHCRDSEGTSALLLAVKLGNIEIIQLLIEYGAKTTDRDNDGYSVYHMMAEHLRPKVQARDEDEDDGLSVLKINRIVKLFSNLGVDINGKDKAGNTPLHSVNLGFCNLEMLKLLLNCGADIFAKNNKGETALKWACCCKGVSSAKLLLDMGADIKEVTRGIHYGRYISKLLLHYGANVNDLVGPAAVFSNSFIEESLELFLDYGGNVNETVDGSSTLSLVIEESDSTGVQLLLDYNANIDIEAVRRIIRKADRTEFSNTCNNFDRIGCAATVTRHIVKLTAANEDVPEDILQDIDGNDVLKGVKIQCEAEIEKMKSGDCEVPVWRVLASDHYLLANAARNEETVQFLASKDCALKYPIYSSCLKNQMRRGIWRRILLNRVKNFFNAVAESEGNEHLPKFPELCVDKIFSYFSNRDFRSLIKVCDPYGEFELDLCNIIISKQN